jgi:ribonuclease HI
VQFHSRVTTKGTLADAFRIFTEGNETRSHTAPLVMFTYVNHGPRAEVYTDGSVIDNDTDDVKAGARVYFGEGDPRNRSLRVR